jgi:hypothetical protein
MDGWPGKPYVNIQRTERLHDAREFFLKFKRRSHIWDINRNRQSVKHSAIVALGEALKGKCLNNTERHCCEADLLNVFLLDGLLQGLILASNQAAANEDNRFHPLIDLFVGSDARANVVQALATGVRPD